MEFESFPKITRLKRNIVITEKIDGTNAQIAIGEDGEFFTGSRNRWLTPENDNYGFSRWAHEHKEELMLLGPGRHFGEWWGQGIQRRYDMEEKVFSLFNVARWYPDNPNTPSCCRVVPVLYEGNMDTGSIQKIMDELRQAGSFATPHEFMKPEGIVVWHSASKVLSKLTFDYDETGKPE